MNPLLRASLDRLLAGLAADPRVLGAFLWGSLADGTADVLSDVDLAVVVGRGDYEAFHAGLPALCEAACGPLLVWLPEGESADAVNYAFLYETGEGVLLYDLTVQTREALSRRPPSRPEQILLDRHGILAAAIPAAPGPAAEPDGAGVLRCIDNYWVYAYLNGKYWRRGDLFKLLYVQQTLFQHHLSLLRLLHPGAGRGWWAKDVQGLPSSTQEALLTYFGAAGQEQVAAALLRELDLFSHDARAACERWGLEYPEALEYGVRRHLEGAGIRA